MNRATLSRTRLRSVGTTVNRTTTKKKVRVVKPAERDDAAALAGLPSEGTLALGDIAGAIREGLLAFSRSTGRLVVQQLVAAR